MKYIIALLLIPMALGVCNTQDLADSTVLYYDLEETGFDYDDSAGNLDLTAGSASTQTTGKLDYGQDFGSDKLQTSTNSMLELKNFSLNMWLNPDNHNNHYAIFDLSYNLQYGCWGEYRSNQVIYVWCYDTTSGVDRGRTTTTISDGNWHMITVTHTDNEEINIYIDGVEAEYDYHDTSIVGYSASNHKLSLGVEFDTDRNFDGQMDEVAYFDKELSQDCISYLNNSGSPGATQQYPFSSGSANESDARAAIETGINNVLASPTIYTDKQMYLRYDNGTQQLISFDKVAYYNNQYWGFNYYTDDTNEDAPTMGTSFYSWLNSSLTTSEITSQVQGLIEATKN